MNRNMNRDVFLSNAKTLEEVYEYITTYHYSNSKGSRNDSLFLFLAHSFKKGFWDGDIENFARKYYSSWIREDGEGAFRATWKSAKDSDIANSPDTYQRTTSYRGVTVGAGNRMKAQQKGRPIGTPKFSDVNVMTLLEILGDRYEVRLNEVTQNFEILDKLSLEPKWEPRSKNIDNGLFSFMRDRVKGVRKNDLLSFIFNNDTVVYNPVEEYIKGLPPYDGSDYFEEFLSYITFGDPDFSKRQFKHFYISMINTMLTNEINENVLVFTGKQGVGKTTLVDNILPPYFKDYVAHTIADARDEKQNYIQFSRMFLTNYDEVKNFKALRNKLDQLVTARGVADRELFTESLNDRQRNTSYICTTNLRNIVDEMDGARRYSIHEIICMNFDLVWEFDKEKLFIQAHHLLVNEGYKVFQNPDSIEERMDRNRKYREPSIVEELFDERFEYTTSIDDLKNPEFKPMTCSQIADDIQHYFPSSRADVNHLRIGHFLSGKEAKYIEETKDKKRYLIRTKPIIDNAINERR